MDKEQDAKCVRLLARVDKLRAELKLLEPQLVKAKNEYAKRRGYYGYFGEWNLRNTIEMERNQQLEDAADRNDWEKANA